MDKNANNPKIWIWNRAFVLMEMSDKTDLLNITASVFCAVESTPTLGDHVNE